MAGWRIVACVLVAALLVCAMASPTKPRSGGETGRSNVRPRLHASEDTEAREDRDVQMRVERMVRMAHLTEDQRELMTKQITQAILERIANSECMSERVYRGWLDFGRRSSE